MAQSKPVCSLPVRSRISLSAENSPFRKMYLNPTLSMQKTLYHPLPIHTTTSATTRIVNIQRQKVRSLGRGLIALIITVGGALQVAVQYIFHFHPIDLCVPLCPLRLCVEENVTAKRKNPSSHSGFFASLDCLLLMPDALPLQQRILRPMRVIPRRAHIRLRVVQHIGVKFRSIRNRRVLGKLQRLHADVLQFGLHRVEIGF
jgi:hypothetical protein